MSGLRFSAAAAALEPAQAQVAADLHRLDAPVGLARLAMPDGAVAPPLVIVLPDAIGEDGRSEPYVDSLPATSAPALILQDDAATARCRDLQPAPGIDPRLLADAGHGWDVPGSVRPSGRPLLADPSGGAPLRTHPDLNVTLTAAEAVADWFEALLLNANRSTSR